MDRVRLGRYGAKLKNTQILWVDYIRVVACFMVVLLHSTAPLLYKFNSLSLSDWFIGNVYDSLVRVCVPLFFMISGFLLLQKEEPLTAYFSKRFSKLFIPTVFWSIFFVLWKSFIEQGSPPTFRHFYRLVLTPGYYHLWFLYALMGLYLFVPILRRVTQSANSSLLIYYCVIWFLAVSIIPLIEKVSGIDSRIDLGSISGFIGYFVLGLVLGQRDISSKAFFTSLFLYSFLVFVTAMGTYFLTVKNGGVFSEYFYSYLAPNTILAAIACFAGIKYLVVNCQFLQKKSMKDVVRTISSCSFGIYLVHTVFLYLLKSGHLGFKLSPFSGDPLLYVPLTSVIVFMMSFCLIFMIKKIPILKLVAP